MKKDLIKQAQILGQNAFKNNLKSIPVMDVQLMNFISSVRSEIGTKVGASTFLFKAWSKGWHSANLKGSL